LYNRADLLIVPSKGVKKLLIKEFKIKIPIKVIPNPIDTKLINQYRVEELDNEKERDIFKNQVFLCVGRFNHVKNHKNTIKIFSKYLKSTDSDSQLVFLGEGELLSECKNYTKEIGLEDRIHFLGFKNNVYKYMSKSYAMLLNSKWESFGNVIIEAFACGCPVISTDIPVGPREIFKDKLLPSKKEEWYEEYDCGLLIKAQSEQAYVKSLKIASNDERWSEKRKLASEISLKYSLDNICDEYKNIFLEY
jgi:N-acetylgalactosamine-N,N'-diacetylbacillosaminyl-diphospho-undecaprenol 4-alpha-N-acetylgalactosaminyltransferase